MVATGGPAPEFRSVAAVEGGRRVPVAPQTAAPREPPPRRQPRRPPRKAVRGGWLSDNALPRLRATTALPRRRSVPRRRLARGAGFRSTRSPATSPAMIDNDAARRPVGSLQRRRNAGVFHRRRPLHAGRGSRTFDEIRKRYTGPTAEFKQDGGTATSRSFERLLDEVGARRAAAKRWRGTYLTSETGKVYTMLGARRRAGSSKLRLQEIGKKGRAFRALFLLPAMRMPARALRAPCAGAALTVGAARAHPFLHPGISTRNKCRANFGQDGGGHHVSIRNGDAVDGRLSARGGDRQARQRNR